MSLEVEEKKVEQAQDLNLKRELSSPEPTGPPAAKKQQKQQKQQKKKKRKYKNKFTDETTPFGVLQFEIEELLGEQGLKPEQIINNVEAILNEEVDETVYHRIVNNVKILRLSSNGDGIALIDHPEIPDHKQVCVVPFGLPNDIVNIKVFKTHPKFVETDLLEIVESNSGRKEEDIKCKYFGKCSGCQYQGLSYETQLEFKKQTVSNAYKYFAKELVKQGKIPEIGSTVPSPKQFGYRTKLTPHFDIPRKRALEKVPPMGFGSKGKPHWRNTAGGDASVVDIEECVIGTEMINIGMKNERSQLVKNWSTYKKSATILLREHTRVVPKDVKDLNEFINSEAGSKDEQGVVSHIIEHAQDNSSDNNDNKLVKTCVTQSRQIVTEYINGFTFEFSAGEFFQNNNSILPKVTEYVCSNLQIPKNKEKNLPLYLVDAYCGSGLFSITASKGVDTVVGVDVSADSISFARKNAERNGVVNAKFIDGKAEKIFAEITTPNDQTSVIIDPSRKGCDDVFLNQLSDYMPAKIVYISCNVHSQARDVEFFLNKTENGGNYKIESIRGFDFFPQTHHVESVAVISRI